MKTFKFYFSSLLIVFFLFSIHSFAQSQAMPTKGQGQVQSKSVTPELNQTLALPTTMNYQAVARNSSGAILATQTVGLRLTIEDGAGGAVLYQERQTPTTNQFGLLTLKLGSGTVLAGTWAGINWSNGNQWLKVDMDPTGGNSYVAMGESELLTVPFAVATAAVSGTTNYVSKFTSPGAIGSSQIYDDGTYIGIGTATPQVKLDVQSNTFVFSRLKTTSGWAGIAMDKGSITDNNYFILQTGGTDRWTLGTMGVDDFTLHNWPLASDAINVSIANNNVGIGTSTPAHKLHAVDPTEYAAVIYGENTFSGGGDGIGVYGRSVNNPDWGYGVYGEGGYMGMYALGNGTTNTGTTYGISANATGSAGTHIGVYSTAGGGTDNYGGWFDGKTHIAMSLPGFTTPADAHLSIDALSGPSYPSITLYSSSAGGGAGIFGITGSTGINVGDNLGGPYSPVNASAFNVMSDVRMKHDISNIGETTYSKYLEYIRNIQSATFKYNSESNEQRPVPHIGVIAQSLPVEVQAHMTASPSKSGEERLGVSLADMSGLLLVGVKALDSKQSQFEKEIADLKAEIQQLKNK